MDQGYFTSFDIMSHELRQSGFAIVPKIETGSLLCHNRCGITAHFLYNTDADVLLWIDADEAWRPGDAAAILYASEKLQLVGGAYCKKVAHVRELPWKEIAEAARAGVPDAQLQFVGQKFAFGFLPEDVDVAVGYTGPTMTMFGRRLIRVSHAGTGFFAMTREALTVIASRAPKVDGGMPILFNNLATNKFVGEDTHFCRLAREAGFSIWLDTETRIDHHGIVGFTGDLSGDRLHDFARREAVCPS